MSVIDTHTHVWPDAVTPRHWRSRTGPPQAATGSEHLTPCSRRGMDKAVCLGVAVVPEQVELANRFAGSLDPSRYIGFGSVHAALSPEENLSSLRATGCAARRCTRSSRGRLDDPGLLETLDAMQGEFAVTIHVGAGAAATSTRAARQSSCAGSSSLPAPRHHCMPLRGLSDDRGGGAGGDGLPVYVDTAWPPTVAGVGPKKLRR